MLVANGNLNGRVIRLIADEVHRTGGPEVRLIQIPGLTPLAVWPEERVHPHAIPTEHLDTDEAEALVRNASVLVVAPSWGIATRRLVGVARRYGTPVVCVVADVGYGARKLDVTDASELPDVLCVADPITRSLLLGHGIPRSIIREAGSPYFDALLAGGPLPPASGDSLRVAVLANPDGRRERLSNPRETVPDDIVPVLDRVMSAYPRSSLTLRLHPRQTPDRIAEAFILPSSAVLDPFPAQSTTVEFMTAHHLIAGSYSMGLMVARLLGRPAVSFQPPMGDDGLRREIFAAWDVPVATDEDALAALVADRLRCPGTPVPPETVLYQPGRSLSAIMNVIAEAQAPRFRGLGMGA